MRQVHDKFTILALLSVSMAAIERGILALFERQTADEQDAHETVHRNRAGFSWNNAEDGCRFGQLIQSVQQVYHNAGYTDKDVPYGSILPKDDLPRAHEICKFHAWQLANIANAKWNGPKVAA